MALGRATINKLSEQMSTSHNYLSKYYDRVGESINTLQSNVNYQSFIENTEIGRSLNEKLNRIKGVGDKTASDVGHLLDTTDQFVENQSILNSEEGGSMGVGAVGGYQGEPQSMGIGASAGDITPTTITAGQAAGTESGMIITNGKVTIPGGTSIPGSAVTRW